MTEQLAVAPGWYQDPRDADLIRWWDGAAWSRQTEPRPAEVENPVATGYVAPTQTPAYQAPAYQAPGFELPAYAPEQAAAAAAYVPMQVRVPTHALYQRPAKRGDRDREVRRANPLAWTGIVLALVGMIFSGWFIPSIVGIIFSAIGLSKSSTLARTRGFPLGRGHAIAGLIVGGATIVLGVIFISVEVARRLQ
ncbi:DUF2510 domain-containing protein [Naasia lichenicola]|uniref:DUF2510 domain-containing protein n=1 Tax=Naasia lichenicola TaxID=2565933 RepID=A0A4S4FUH7_9MICO|nr:DUF2510 domain-containing protein [Naasia lichenicola]THG33256.1 DUF2510 domain-containing protein [Naasia lichenicola]